MTRRSKVWWLSWVMVAVTVFPLPAARSQPSDLAQGRPAVDRNTVVIGTVENEPHGLNPFFGRGQQESFWEIFTVLFTQDIQRDAAWRPFPQGVEYLPSAGDGTWRLDGEKMTLVWKLRPRRWHDGHPVTCADYVFTHRLQRDERVRERNRLSRIANVSCPEGESGLEVVVSWTERYAYANLWVIDELAAIPRHVVEPSYRANPAGLRSVPYGNDPKYIIGDGPYRLVEWQRRHTLTLEAVAGHPIFGTPRIKRIIWRFIPDRETLFTSLLSGGIDATFDFTDFTFRTEELERQSQGRLKASTVPSTVWEHIDFNLDNPLLQDARVRRAIAHAINRTQIVQLLFASRQPIAHSYLHPKHPGYTDDVRKYSYDPARARALLREAGFAPGPDGIMRDAAGQRLTLEISTTTGNRVREQVEQIIQEQLRQVGIEITILNLPLRVLISEHLARRRFKALVIYFWNFGPDSGCNLLYTSDGIPTEMNGWAGGNHPGYKNPAMDGLCKAASREIDAAKRNELLRESARIFSSDLPALPLWFRVTRGVAKAGLRNLIVTGLPEPNTDTWNAHLWYWE